MNFIKNKILVLSILSTLSFYATANNETSTENSNLSKEEAAIVQQIIEKQIPYPQFEMASRYYFGNGGLSQDYQKAMFWFLGSSKDENNPAADMMIASMFFDGVGAPKNEIEGLKYYHLAAQKGSSEAQVILASIYFFNANFMDKENAYLYFNQALKNGNKYAYMLKSVMELNVDADKKTIDKLMPSLELTIKDNEYSQFMLGYFYMTGKMVDRPDIDKAEKLFRLAALKNNPVATVIQRELLKVKKVENEKSKE